MKALFYRLSLVAAAVFVAFRREAGYLARRYWLGQGASACRALAACSGQ
jgi:hypothetical protein